MARDGSRAVTRRTMLAGAAVGAAAALLPAGGAFAAANYSVIPKLPGEVSRLATQTTRIGKKKYEAIDVVVAGDRTRIFVPHAVAPGATGTLANTVWFYHAYGSTYTALSSAFLYSAMMCLDKGWVCVGPNFGGASQWVNSVAIAAQQQISVYMSANFNIKDSFLRANSGGGSLMCYAYGTRAVPKLRGMYLANASYDMEDLYQRAPGDVGPAYGNDPTRVAATNPARLDASVWSGARIRACVSQADIVVPPAQHGVALVNTALPVAAEASLVWHDQGHTVPDLVHKDMVAAFTRWQTV